MLCVYGLVEIQDAPIRSSNQYQLGVETAGQIENSFSSSVRTNLATWLGQY